MAKGLRSWKLLTQLCPEWRLPMLQTACWRESVERHRPGRDRKEQQMEWQDSQSPPRRLLLSGLLRTEDLMAAPRWWEGWKTERTGSAVSREREGTRLASLNSYKVGYLTLVLKLFTHQGSLILAQVFWLWVVRAAVGDLQVSEDHPLGNKCMIVRRFTSISAPQAAGIFSHHASLITSVQIAALIRFN